MGIEKFDAINTMNAVEILVTEPLIINVIFGAISTSHSLSPP